MVERNFQGLSLISARRLASPESSSAWDHLCPAHAGDTQVRRQADPPSEERDDIKIVSQLLIIITNSLEDQHSPENILSSLTPTSYIPTRIRPLMQHLRLWSVAWLMLWILALMGDSRVLPTFQSCLKAVKVAV